MKSDYLLPLLLAFALLAMFVASVFVFCIKSELDLIRDEFDSEVTNAKDVREQIHAQLKSVPSGNRSRRQSYYESVTEGYSKPSAGVEAQPPSFSPNSFPSFCNCNAQNNCPAGPPGAPGPKGHKGHNGDDGPPGKPGNPCEDVHVQMYETPCQYCPAGQQGPSGPNGVQGPRGLRGQHGSNGMPGFNGMPGRNGDMGSPGTEGPTGVLGKPGRAGMDAVKEQGLPGLKGAPGEQGSIGPRGDRGNDGNAGAIGKSGAIGKAGKAGRRGKDGRGGKQGEAGLPGADAMYCPCPHRSAAVSSYATGPGY